MIGGICQLRQSGSDSGKIAKTTLIYYGCLILSCSTGFSAIFCVGVTTISAVILGIILVNLIQPGVGHSFNASDANSDDWRCTPVNVTATRKKAVEAETGDETVDALLGVLRKMFPKNILKAAVDMNILGVICFAVGFGVMLSGMGERADSMIDAIEVFNHVIMKMVTAALWFAPVGITRISFVWCDLVACRRGFFDRCESRRKL